MEPDAPAEPPSWAPALSAAAGGLGLGALGYGLLRRRTLAADPRLRAIQEASGGRFTRVLKGSEPDSALGRWWKRTLWAGGGDVVYKKNLDAARKGGVVKIPGAVRHYRRDGIDFVRGDVNLSANPATRALYKRLSNDKWEEYKLFSKLAPGSMGRSEHLPVVLRRLGYDKVPADPAGRQKMFAALQEDLRARYGKGFFLKDVLSADTGGHFPTDKDDFLKMLRRKDPESRRVFDKIVADPRSAMVQERLPIEQASWLGRLKSRLLGERAATKELRVHVVNGAVLPGMTVPRFDPMMRLTGRHHMRGADAFAAKLMRRLPAKYRDGSFAMDIAPIQGGGYRLIESNPSGVSGFFNPKWNPLGGFAMHKAFTGQHSRPVAAAGAAALGAVGAGAGYGLYRLKGDAPTGSTTRDESSGGPPAYPVMTQRR